MHSLKPYESAGGSASVVATGSANSSSALATIERFMLVVVTVSQLTKIKRFVLPCLCHY